MKEQVLKFVQITGTANTIKATIEQIVQQYRDGISGFVGNHSDKLEAALDVVRAALNEAVPTLEANIVDVYSKTFTEDDMTNIVAFYETPTGTRLLETGPQIMKAISDASDEWSRSVLHSVDNKIGEILSQIPELPPEPQQ
jgi:hypothetical protein